MNLCLHVCSLSGYKHATITRNMIYAILSSGSHKLLYTCYHKKKRKKKGHKKISLHIDHVKNNTIYDLPV